MQLDNLKNFFDKGEHTSSNQRKCKGMISALESAHITSIDDITNFITSVHKLSLEESFANIMANKLSKEWSERTAEEYFKAFVKLFEDFEKSQKTAITPLPKQATQDTATNDRAEIFQCIDKLIKYNKRNDLDADTKKDVQSLLLDKLEQSVRLYRQNHENI